jgi:hypothetical protein
MPDSRTDDGVKHVGFISTRIAGTDGVSLELEKWADVFKKFGWTSFYFAGELDRPPERSYLAEEAHFTHPEIKTRALQENLSAGNKTKRRFIRLCQKI